MAKLKELNPGFDGKETHVVARDSVAGIANNPPRSGGLLTELSFSSVAITNIVPVKALTGLKKLTLLPWTKGGKSALADLTPLAGLPLTFLACGNSQVSDLAPLRGMPLTILSVDNTPVSDLSPLAGMPLTILWCDKTKVADLSPIAGAPLVELRCDVKPEHAPLLASIPTLRKINDLTPAALWMRMGIKAPVAAVYDRRNVPGTTTDGGHRPPLQTTTTTPDQGTGPATFKPGTPAQPGLSYVTTIGMELCYIPSGEFLLGSTPEERAWA
ncbi:MAG: leucine-rich repeat domain-containing protein, partial [Verrucomicrobia bacterium]|nr:leucine-rich repeat domain-containing protein [Verrucomicrobiota bacterium]